MLYALNNDTVLIKITNFKKKISHYSTALDREIYGKYSESST